MRNVGPSAAKSLGHRVVQFIDHVASASLYSRLMDVFPPKAHARSRSAFRGQTNEAQSHSRESLSAV